MLRFFRRSATTGATPDPADTPATPSPGEVATPTVADSLERTRGGFFGAVRNLFRARQSIDETLWDDLEERLIAADVGAHVTSDLVDELRAQNRRRPFVSGADAESALRSLLEAILAKAGDTGIHLPVAGPAVILVIGVNGTGKTTTIAKLTKYLSDAGRRPFLVAGDTFRAAAIDQLKVWGDRVEAPVYAQSPGSDPAAVVFDGLGMAIARQSDTILIDTAGRLHTKANLMAELEKVRRVIKRRLPDAPHETLLVLDAVTGQNGLMQAKAFLGQVGVTGLVLTKLDSSAKGGVVFAIADELKVPIKLVGTGERLVDLQPFDPQEFVHALFA